jgi:hypothetical protein
VSVGPTLHEIMRVWRLQKVAWICILMEVWLAFDSRWLGGETAQPIAPKLCARIGCAPRLCTEPVSVSL